MLIEFFQSDFSSKISFDLNEIEPENPEKIIFSVSEKSRRNILLAIGPKKDRVPDCLPQMFYQKTCNEKVKCLNKNFKNEKHLRNNLIVGRMQQFHRFS